MGHGAPSRGGRLAPSTKWAEVDVAALRDNASALCHLAGSDCAVMAMVKANGYGHGAVTAARAALAGGATWLGVSSMVEALELRRAGINVPVLNVGWTMPAEMGAAISNSVDVAVFSPADVASAREAARGAPRPMRVHWKIDTGMGRLGTRLEDVELMRDTLVNAGGPVEVAGIFTHFASADEEALEVTVAAHERFMSVVSRVAGALGAPLLHCANSAAALRLDDTHHDIIRPGIAFYGYPPAFCQGAAELRPALSVCALITQVKDLVAGDTVGYGREWVAQRRTRVATVAAGYADGVDRRNGNHGAVVAGGAVCPIIGRVSMDQMSIDISEVADLRAGDPVVLIGEQGGHRIDAAEIAASIGTISYEVLCAVSSRVPRVAINDIEE